MTMILVVYLMTILVVMVKKNRKAREAWLTILRFILLLLLRGLMMMDGTLRSSLHYERDVPGEVFTKDEHAEWTRDEKALVTVCEGRARATTEELRVEEESTRCNTQDA